VRENFDPDVLLGLRPFGKRVWLVSKGKPDGQGAPLSTERPKLVVIRGGSETEN
jgi:hypothetical protein